jgi:hypothetical protein
MQPTTPPSNYSHPRLIQLIQLQQPEHDAAVRAVHKAAALVRDMKHAERQLTKAQAQLQQTIPAQQ